jgi:hypothetical protein
LQRVAQFRSTELSSLETALKGYAEIAEARWRAWLAKQRLENTIPTNFSAVLEQVVSFADPLIAVRDAQSVWNPVQGKWI